jgi:hypothetical protein
MIDPDLPSDDETEVVDNVMRRHLATSYRIPLRLRTNRRVAAVMLVIQKKLV